LMLACTFCIRLSRLQHKYHKVYSNSKAGRSIWFWTRKEERSLRKKVRSITKQQDCFFDNAMFKCTFLYKIQQIAALVPQKV
jgi:hypothetical protein